ncbi:LuxR family transcriptional regulator [Actinoplanes sp. SE50]|uniref:response regulator transcription factor n=1 Tax=unclassified Actinoplanes TaxID=2626549 RepID=UPI00023EC448|nr:MULTISPECIES: response regulator transcription factor [unclassified Actinoplanes]AEV84118.1 Response regulator gacA [Actinoplanes sp. SE50/110]ATO82510.1 LuxR family transcriptional regulator [Actinoplanes sp. SE50]SLL99917.1 LuxR-family transcriptional regulator [Actinoplanes sp. SE50/110]
MRIVIAEDAAMLRAGLTDTLVNRGHEVPAAVADGDGLLAAVAKHRPDVAIIDIRMPPTHTDEGLRAAIQIRRDHPDVGVMLFSQYVESRHTNALLRGGAQRLGYLLKDRVADVSEFIDALARVAAGGTVLDPEVVTQLFNSGASRGRLSGLTGREREVLALMAEGRSNTAIAEQLVLAYASVEKHITSIFTKLGLPASASDHRRVLAVLQYLRVETLTDPAAT